MNKKQISVMVSLAIILVSGTPLFSADKKDVADPVLKEVINELSPKMPRFIDKYGPNIFVSDEQVTRSALLLALYEYDKRNSAASLSANFVSKKDFDSLNTRVSVIEKSGQTGKSSASSAGTSVDMIKLMNDLDPNMPMLLDNNLANSKVFKDLQKKVDMMGLASSSGSGQQPVSNVAMVNMKTDISNLSKRIEAFEMSSKSAGSNVKPSKELDDLKLSFAQIQKSYVNIAKRLDELENKPLMASSSDGRISNAQIEALNARINSIKNEVSDIPTNNNMKSEINKTSADVKRLEQKINELESSGVSAGSGASKSSTGTFAKISLGLTMVAALFVAR